MSSASQYQSIRPLISMEMNTSKVNYSSNNVVRRDDVINSLFLQINDSGLNEDSPRPSCSRSLSNPSTNSPPITRQSSRYIQNYIQSRTNRVTMTLLLVSCSFLLLNSPYCAIWLANYVQRFRNTTLKSVKEITELFMLTNFCINFLLYCLSGKTFRSELMCLLRCRWKELYDKHETNRTSKRKARPINHQYPNRDKYPSMRNPYSNRS